jgi:hypothetical protein
VEQFRALSGIPKELIDTFEETADIADLAKLMHCLTSRSPCDSREKNHDTSGASRRK